MGILQLIASRNFITVNKDLMKLLGVNEAIILGELASEFDYWENQQRLEDGYFYSTIENIENHTTLSEHKQRKALNNLKNLGLVDIKVKGIPAKRYIKINEEQVFNLFNDKFLKNLGTGTKKNEELDIKKSKGNNNILNNNINNKNIDNNIDIYSPAEAEQSIPYKEIIDYLNQSINSNYKSTTKKTKDLIKARYNDGFVLEDFKEVIDKKIVDWIKDKEMSKYLRPETLFGPKFESYLNQQIKMNTTKDLAEAGALDFSKFR